KMQPVRPLPRWSSLAWCCGWQRGCSRRCSSPASPAPYARHDLRAVAVLTLGESANFFSESAHRPPLARCSAQRPAGVLRHSNLACSVTPAILTRVERVFDSVVMGTGAGQVTRLPPRLSDGAGLGAGTLPVLPALKELLPRGLPRGGVVAAGSWGLL